jgi:hypothetical protein
VAWLEGLPYTLSLPSHHALVVHAGLVPGKPLGQQTGADMSRMRNLLVAVSLWGRRGAAR